MRILFFTILLSGLISAQSVRVATAANMGYVLPKIVNAFHQKYPNVQIEIAIGGSGKLRAQIENGAPYDLFLSANTAYPQVLYEKGFGLGKPVVYAQGELVLFSKDGLDLTQGVSVLIRKCVGHIAMANPKTAPYGKAAKEALMHAGIWNAVSPKIVYGESISQTVIYALRMVDVGIIARSALFAKRVNPYMKKATFQPVDEKLYSPIDQGMLLLTHAKENKDAVHFYRFLCSKEAKVILRRYGYRVP